MPELEKFTCPQNREIFEVNGGGHPQVNASPKSWQPSMWKPSKKLCIYRVPRSIKISHEAAYVPLVVSFGPYRHEMNTKVSGMDPHKVEALNTISKRFNVDKNNLIQEIASLDSATRKCYDEAIEWDKDTLAKMLAMDVCFIIQFFTSYNHENTVRFHILNDIMKLENQIPFFIVEAIYKLIFKKDDVTSQLTELLFGMFTRIPFYDISAGDGVSFHQLEEYIKKTPFHLLDLKRMVVADLLSAAAVEPGDYGDADRINCAHCVREWCVNVTLPVLVKKFWPTYSPHNFTPSAELLHKVGIKFKAGDIGFESNKLSLPRVIVDDSTEIVLRNLMAYEECQRCSRSPKSTVISHFVSLLDDLIESEKDVSILREGGIISHLLGSDKEVANTFNQLGKGISIEPVIRFMFQSVAQRAREHYYNPWKKPFRRVKEAHCSKPLYWVSALAGTAILVMTAVQMVYAIKGG
ncbi:hypothetical protein SUGI_0693460 [Cryptomeria japonica]|uniref:UPF0481 protein At3g47200-like n=1 Tax=Cryptomeria japonica TaxID=3369 RepID=UPI0024148254|nr:UPF0481 protein At3g47200-like [Cryptomeria japonica]GLJ34478.1 hypothetical protein SUGI_0693460 [Cryptomeria japonica]